jgi:hypothetical protein
MDCSASLGLNRPKLYAAKRVVAVCGCRDPMTRKSL